MKKILMATTVALVAIGVNAATVNWGNSKGYVYDGATANKITSGSAYLMYVTGSYDQSKLIDAFVAADGDASATLAAMSASGAMATGAGTIGSNARVTGASTYDISADGTAYMVIFNNDKMYVSITASAVYDPVSGEVDATFASLSDSSKLEFDASKGYSAAGWYKISGGSEPVPEPTTGMLVLLGVAGLALRRRRA